MAITERSQPFVSGVEEYKHGVIDVLNNALDKVFSTA